MSGWDRVHMTVFTKPWKTLTIPELGEFVAGLGLSGVELPVRPGYQVPPEKVSELPRVARAFRQLGLSITSVAGPTDEATIAACGEAGVSIIRICEAIDDDGYLATEARLQRKYAALVPLLDKHRVTLGIQNHSGNHVASAMGLRHLIEQFDPRHIAAVWDPAHTAVSGEEPHLAIDILASHLCMVNLKNVFWQRTNGPEAPVAEWSMYWTTGRHGLASWPRVVELLRARGYAGPVCLCAEYSSGHDVNRLIAQDIAFAKSIFEG